MSSAGATHTRVVICGGGVAALEALLALRALLPVGAHIDLVAPNERFVYQPLAVAEPFGLAEAHRFDIAEIAADQRALLHADSLAAVDTEACCVELASRERLPYDALIVAVGARRQKWLDGALHFGGATDVRDFRMLLEQLERGAIKRLAFATPPAATWTLPLYELALLTAARMADIDLAGAELALVTAEQEPLSVFGPGAGRLVREMLDKRAVRLLTAVQADRIVAGHLELRPEGSLTADRVVTLPSLAGPAVPGLPADSDGFIPIDEHCRVQGLDAVYAAGDGTAFPHKQGGIAAQQADAAVEAIAAAAGAEVTPAPFEPMLRGMLLTGIAPTYLRADAGASAGLSEVGRNPLWWPPTKIAGRHLGPYLAGEDSHGEANTLEDREARPATGAVDDHTEARELAMTFADADAAGGDYRSALRWLDVLERLDGVLPAGYLDKRTEWQRATGGGNRPSR